MEKNKNNIYNRISYRVNCIRRLYSEIGEPLDANIIIDLYCHLGGALQLFKKEKTPNSFKKRLS